MKEFLIHLHAALLRLYPQQFRHGDAGCFLDDAIENFVGQHDNIFPDHQDILIVEDVDRHFAFIWEARIQNKIFSRDGDLTNNDSGWVLMKFIHTRKGWVMKLYNLEGVNDWVAENK